MKLFGTKRNAAHYERKGGKVRKVIIILFVLALLVTGGVYAFTTFFIRPPDVPEFIPPPRSTPGLQETPPPVEEEEPEPEEEEPEYAQIFTLMVAGQDNVGAHGLSDTIMLVSMDVTNGRVSVINVPRDLKADEPWTGLKINAVYSWTGGSIDSLMESMEAMTGFGIHNYVIIDMQAFVRLVDAIDGVNFDVPRRMHYSDPYQNLYIDLHPGYQLLDGAQALHLVRWRQNNAGTAGYVDGDLGRIRTQQDFMGALARELLQVHNVLRIPELIRIFSENVDTDLALGSILWYANELSNIDSENITFLTMPNLEALIGGVYYQVILLDEWLEMVNAHLNPWLERGVEIGEENLRTWAWKDGTVQLVGEGITIMPRVTE